MLLYARREQGGREIQEWTRIGLTSTSPPWSIPINGIKRTELPRQGTIARGGGGLQKTEG